MVRSTFITIDTHKVQEDGGENSGLLLLFNKESSSKDNVLDGIVHWILLRMKRSITGFSTELQSLVLLKATNDVVNADAGKVFISDTEDAEIVNASIEMEKKCTIHLFR